jgi:hypothetical protein
MDTEKKMEVQGEPATASPSPGASRQGETPYVETDEEALHAPGSMVEYTEDGSLLLCKVLENTCDKEWLRYKLEVVKQLASHPFSGDAKPGEIFEPNADRRYCFSGMWHIHPLGTYTRPEDRRPQ